jgi:hypothetical protein
LTPSGLRCPQLEQNTASTVLHGTPRFSCRHQVLERLLSLR